MVVVLVVFDFCSRLGIAGFSFFWIFLFVMEVMVSVMSFRIGYCCRKFVFEDGFYWELGVVNNFIIFISEVEIDKNK